MVTITELGCDDCDDGVCVVQTGNKCGGGSLVIADVGYGDGEIVGGSCEVIGDDRIFNWTELRTSCMLTASAIVDIRICMHVIITYDVEKVIGSENMLLMLKDYVEEVVEQGQSEIEEAPAIDQNIYIQFGSFGYPGDTKSVLKVSNPKIDDIDDGQWEGEGVGDPRNIQTEEDTLPQYAYLVKIPRYENEKLNEQIKNAQVQLDEIRRRRDAILAEMHIKEENMEVHNESFNAKSKELWAARQLVKSKRQQIADVERVIIKGKNVVTVEDVDTRVYKGECKVKSGTLCLKDKQEITREIKQRMSQRAQLAKNMGSPDVNKQQDQIEEHMKELKKELKTLNDDVSKAELACKTVRKQYIEELEMERELRAQFIAARESFQEAFGKLNSLKKYLNDKNKSFHMYEEELMIARHFVSRKEKAALHHLCTKQVEWFMDKWNSSEEFRKDYVNRQTPYTQDEPACVFPDDTDQEVASSTDPTLDEIKSTSTVTLSETQETVRPVEENHLDDQVQENGFGEFERDEPPRVASLSGPTPDEIKFVSAVTDLEPQKKVKSVEEKHSDDPVKENVLGEFAQMIKKEPDEIKEEVEAKLKEKIRLEEKVKADEAEKRKKRNAEKAQTRAEMRAQKEAQQKEKARLKRLRRRERKWAGRDASNIVDGDATESNKSKEVENTNGKPQQHLPPPHFFSKQLKPKFIPPPPAVTMAIRNRKWWGRWRNILVAVMILLPSVVSFTNIDFSRFLPSR